MSEAKDRVKHFRLDGQAGTITLADLAAAFPQVDPAEIRIIPTYTGIKLEWEDSD